MAITVKSLTIEISSCKTRTSVSTIHLMSDVFLIERMKKQSEYDLVGRPENEIL